MIRLLDVIALLIVAVVVLLPQPSINAYPAVSGDQADLERLAALEDAVHRSPDDVQARIELARAYLQVEQPGWALVALAPLRERGLPEVHQVAAFAYATLLLPKEALREAEAGLAACTAARCNETARIRLQYLADLMRKPVEAGVDPKQDPLAAKRAVSEALHATKVPEGALKPPPAPSPKAEPAPKAP